MQYPRITNRYTSESIVNNLLMNRSRLVELQEQISSGKRISKPSDDVLAGISVVSTNNSLGKIDNYLKNIERAQGELDVTEKAIQTMIDSVHTTRELTLQALNATSGPEQMQVINAQVKQIISQIKDIGNTKYGTKYIFGGQQTGSAPFVTPAEGEVQYTGSSATNFERKVEISEGVTVPINLDGREIFGEYYTNPTPPPPVVQSGLLGNLISLSNELDNPTPDKDLIRGFLDNLDNNLQTILNNQSKIGGISSRLEMTKASLQDSQLNLTKIKSGAEDIDMAKAISDLQFQQTALQASLQISAQVIQPSLLNYLR